MVRTRDCRCWIADGVEIGGGWMDHYVQCTSQAAKDFNSLYDRNGLSIYICKEFFSFRPTLKLVLRFEKNYILLKNSF